jgi:dTDP-4-amino-4,6-dideoxygalactose transaminase
LGAHVDAFEAELCERLGCAHGAALSSGTAALHLALILLGVGPGDEVVTSSFTFAATANAITYQGATPVFIDSNRETWNMDPQLLADELAECARRGRLPIESDRNVICHLRIPIAWRAVSNVDLDSDPGAVVW